MQIYKFMNNLYIMNTEKYYYGLDLETTKKDSSIIDCEYPGPRPENPSLNTVNTSILNKASTTSNYVKRDNCPATFTIKKHNDAIMDSSLYVIEILTLSENGYYKVYVYDLFYTGGTKKQIYLGYEDTNKIFTNKLQSIITTQVTTLDSDTAGCSAKAYLIPNDNTGAPIKFSLNKCTADRIITFSYKNTPIFKINQTYTQENMYYTIYVWKINTPNGLGSFAFFQYNVSNPVSVSKNSNLYNKTLFYFNDISNTNQTALFCYSDEGTSLSSTVGGLINGGLIEHVQGHDYLISNKDNYAQLYINPVTDVNVFTDGTIDTDVTTTKATLDMTITIYSEKTNGIYQTSDRIRFGNIDNTSHVGVYKIRK